MTEIKKKISDIVKIELTKCTKCGKCLRLLGGYCLEEIDGFPSIDRMICNACQKCVSICPPQAINVNGAYPTEIRKEPGISDIDFIKVIEKRRSCKKFKAKDVPEELLKKIISVAKYAPNQDKNIRLLVIDNKEMIQRIDERAIRYVKKYYNLLFGNNIVTWLCSLFYKKMNIIKKKMERDLLQRKKVIKDNTPVLLILTGNKRMPAIRGSAYCILSTMMIMTEIVGLSSCFMDSLQLAMNDRKTRRYLGLSQDVLGVLAIGYSDEGVINIPRGYELEIDRNIFV
jgi:nitroreductase/NAD-dependent dihydropyrimidine dehydrogenase PreA subunit